MRTNKNRSIVKDSISSFGNLSVCKVEYGTKRIGIAQTFFKDRFGNVQVPMQKKNIITFNSPRGTYRGTGSNYGFSHHNLGGSKEDIGGDNIVDTIKLNH